MARTAIRRAVVTRRLDARSVGWLRYLYRKATTPDSWEREGRPHAHWDDLSDPPMLCWHRFDLIDHFQQRNGIANSASDVVNFSRSFIGLIADSLECADQVIHAKHIADLAAVAIDGDRLACERCTDWCVFDGNRW